MPKNKEIITGTLVAVALATGVAMLASNDESKIELSNPQKIEWDKPTNDAEWSEDVKKENFDIKSMEVLLEMREAHVAKILKLNEQNSKLTECPDCVRFEIQKQVEAAIEQGAELEKPITELVEDIYQDRLSTFIHDIEKLTQSVERMDNEIRLREEGFVVEKQENEPDPKNVKKEHIRIIND